MAALVKQETAWVARYVAGEDLESIAQSAGQDIAVVSTAVFRAMDRRDTAAVTVKRARRVAQLEAVLNGVLEPAKSGEVKAASVAIKTLTELARIEGLYAEQAAPPATPPGEPDASRRARFYEILSRQPLDDVDLAAALADAGWSRSG